MKNRIFDWGKRYFLAVAPAPCVVGVLLGMGGGMFVGWVLLLFKVFKPTSPSYNTVIPLAVGLALLVGGINYAVCHLFVSCRNKPGAFFAYEVLTAREIDEGRPTRGKLLAAAVGELWFRKRKKGTEIRWFGLPFTDRRREVKVVLSPFSVLLEVAFNGEFDLEEIFDTIVGRSDYKNLDEWLRSRVLEVARTSDAVQQILRQVSRRHPETLLPELKTSLWVALKDVGFPKVLGNIKGVRWTLSYSRTSIEAFEM